MVTTNGTAPLWVLFHIGDANGGNPKNCSKEIETSGTALGPSFDAVTAGQASLQQQQRRLPMVDQTAPAATGSTIHIAPGPNGPWTPVTPHPPGCNNPAPWQHANGTFFMVCDGTRLIRAESVAGPWTTVVNNVSPGGGVPGTYEDPYLYVDARGNWHIIYHVYTTNVPPSCVNSTVSG